MNKQFSIIFVLFAVSMLMMVPSLQDSFADVLSLKKQINLGISVDDLICESGMFKVIREGTNSVACLKTDNVLKLVSKGWAKPVDETLLNTQSIQDDFVLGTIKTLYTEPIKTQFGKVSPKYAVSGYDVAFEICSSSQKIYVPDILIKSDSETQHYEIPETVEPNTCIVSATFIKATDPNSIKITLQNQGDISRSLSDLEVKVSSLQQELDVARKLLGTKSSPDVSQNAKISDLRKQLNETKEDLYRLYFAVYAVPQETYSLQKLSFTGNPIEGESVTLVTAKKALTGENTYDAVFEACAGKNQVRLPIITVSSDMETVNVKLGDKIAPNTCQMSSVKIMSGDLATIQVTPAGHAELNSKITDLESQISKLQSDIVNERNMLRSITHDPNKPSYFNEQLEMHTANIIDLRGQIGALKAQLNEVLYKTYR
jgi:regulator of replication initiation timing